MEFSQLCRLKKQGKIGDFFVFLKHINTFFVISSDVVKSILFFTPLPLISIFPLCVIFPSIVIIAESLHPLFVILNPLLLPLNPVLLLNLLL